jgi:hypothetical protein
MVDGISIFYDGSGYRASNGTWSSSKWVGPPTSLELLPGQGQAKPENSGRKQGVSNVLTSELRSMIVTALGNVGGVQYRELQARQNPAAFLTLLGKVLPREVSGLEGAPIAVTSIPMPRVLLVEIPDNGRVLVPLPNQHPDP